MRVDIVLYMCRRDSIFGCYDKFLLSLETSPFSCVSESAAALANAGALARPAPEDPESAVSGNESDDPPVTENVHIKDEL